MVKRHYYNPLPDLERLDLWDGPRPIPGIDLRIDEATDLLTRTLAPYIAEFDPPMDSTGNGYYIRNGNYESVDAETLYAIVRHTKPRRLYELGSGASSHVISAARSANEAEGHPFTHEIFDPFPFTVSPMGEVEATVHPQRCEDVPDAAFARLERGDILFVDTTHTVKTGGDVNRIVLEVLPQLAPGVLVHLHDIFLPYEYPREWVLVKRTLWAEQYLLQAFLAFNDAFEVVFPAQAVARNARKDVARVVHSFEPDVSPGAFWLQRSG